MVNKFNIPADSFIATALFFSYLPPDIKEARNWKQTFVNIKKEYPQYLRSVASATSVAQLESKLWIIDELKSIRTSPNFEIPYKIVGLLGGWYSNFLTPLLLTNLGVSFVWNFEIDQDVKDISYKFNRKYKEEGKYQCSIKDIMMKTLEDNFDIIINCSCEHMYPMTEFYEQSPQVDALYVLQSTDDDQYDDHINCVGSPEELAEQAHIIDVLYSGTKVLNSGMNRFMVIGYSA